MYIAPSVGGGSTKLIKPIDKVYVIYMGLCLSELAAEVYHPRMAKISNILHLT
jgi:hypothetical protein